MPAQWAWEHRNNFHLTPDKSVGRYQFNWLNISYQKCQLIIHKNDLLGVYLLDCKNSLEKCLTYWRLWMLADFPFTPSCQTWYDKPCCYVCSIVHVISWVQRTQYFWCLFTSSGCCICKLLLTKYVHGRYLIVLHLNKYVFNYFLDAWFDVSILWQMLDKYIIYIIN